MADFTPYILQIQQKIAPELKLKSKAVNFLNQILNNLTQKIIKTASVVVESNHKKTLMYEDIITAVKILCSDDLIKEIQIKGSYAYTAYNASGGTKHEFRNYFKEGQRWSKLVIDISFVANLVDNSTSLDRVHTMTNVYLTGALEALMEQILLVLVGNKDTKITSMVVFSLLMADKNFRTLLSDVLLDYAESLIDLED
jgi:histone H3/H4